MSDYFDYINTFQRATIFVQVKDDAFKYTWVGPEEGIVPVAEEYEKTVDFQGAMKEFNLVKFYSTPSQRIVWYVRKDRLLV